MQKYPLDKSLIAKLGQTYPMLPRFGKIRSVDPLYLPQNVKTNTNMPQESEKNEQIMESPQEETVDVATPNRDAYAQMWSEDNGDVDFDGFRKRHRI